MPYSVFLRPAALRDLKKLPDETRKRIETAIDSLNLNPRPRGAKKLAAFENEWRLRVGSHRILYLIEDAARRVSIARVAHRREAYR